MKVNYFVWKSAKQPDDTEYAFWIENAILLYFAMASQIYDKSRQTLIFKKLPNTDQVGLNTTVWRREGAELQDAHAYLIPRIRIDSENSASQQPEVSA